MQRWLLVGMLLALGALVGVVQHPPQRAGAYVIPLEAVALSWAREPAGGDAPLAAVPGHRFLSMTPMAHPAWPDAPGPTVVVPDTAGEVLPTRVPEPVLDWHGLLQGGEIVRGPSTRARIALTFDGGAEATYTREILDTLRAAHVRATMFLTGAWIEHFPEYTQMMVADGHELANHSYSHPDFTALSAAGILDELARTEAAAQAVGATGAGPFFRPPYGARDARVLNVVSAAGYIPIYWTIDSGDWQAGMTSAQVYARMTSAPGNGAIIVNHLNARQTAEVLPLVIEQLRAQGYELVTVGELLAP